MLDLILSLVQKKSDAGVWHYTHSNANCFQADRSKAGLGSRFQTKGDLSIDLKWNSD